MSAPELNVAADANPQGDVYSVFIESELAAEESRRTEINTRASAASGSAGVQLALATALVIFLRGQDFVPDRSTSAIYVVALVLYLASIVCGLLAARSYPAEVAPASLLHTIVQDRWSDSSTTAKASVAHMQAKSIAKLRDSNKKKTDWLQQSFTVQIVAILVLVVAVAVTILF